MTAASGHHRPDSFLRGLVSHLGQFDRELVGLGKSPSGPAAVSHDQFRPAAQVRARYSAMAVGVAAAITLGGCGSSGGRTASGVSVAPHANPTQPVAGTGPTSAAVSPAAPPPGATGATSAGTPGQAAGMSPSRARPATPSEIARGKAIEAYQAKGLELRLASAKPENGAIIVSYRVRLPRTQPAGFPILDLQFTSSKSLGPDGPGEQKFTNARGGQVRLTAAPAVGNDGITGTLYDAQGHHSVYQVIALPAAAEVTKPTPQPLPVAPTAADAKFIAQADQICAAANRASGPAATKFGALLGGTGNGSNAQRLAAASALRQLLVSVRGELDRLRALRPPAGQQKALDAFLAALASEIGYLGQFAALLPASGDGQAKHNQAEVAFNESGLSEDTVSQDAVAVGFKVCGTNG